MNIFISWSGEKSNKTASELKELIESCIQSVEVFFSQTDIEKGEQWFSRITEELSKTNYGIVCLTKSNVNAKWINFEAGALSKLDNSRLAIVNIDVKNSEVGYPLSLYQAITLNKKELKELVLSINRFSDNSIDEKKVSNTFEKFYPDFERNIQGILSYIEPNSSNDSVEIISQIAKLEKENNDYLKKLDFVMPTILEQSIDVSQIDYKKKNDKLVDELFTLLYELNNLDDEQFSLVASNLVLNILLTHIKKIMSVDKVAKHRLNDLYERVENKVIMKKTRKASFAR